MPVKVGTLLNNLAKKAGYDTDNPAFTEVLSANLELPDDLVSALDSKLLTEESAKNSPVLKKYFRSQILDGVDKNVMSLLDEFEFDEDSRKEITGIENTYERIPALAKKIRDLEVQKASASKTDKTQLQEQINQLNKEKAQLVKQYDDEIKKIRQEAQQEITTTLFRNSLSEVDLAEDQFDRETMLTLAEQRLNKELAAQGAKVVNRNGTLTLVQVSDETLDFYKDNKLVSYRDFRDEVLASARIIKVNRTPSAGQTGTQAVNGNTSQATTTQSAPVNNSLMAQIEKAKSDFVNTGS